MKQQQPTPGRYVQPYRYPSPNIPLSAIKRFAKRIADKFHPEKIVLFGSYAYGTPHEESDVDLLVIMPCRNAIDQSVRIRRAFDRLFSVDIVVRTPRQMDLGLREGDWDWFLREIMEKGKVLYEAPHSSVGSQGGGRLASGKKPGKSNQAATGHSRVSLSAGRGKILQGTASRARRTRAKDA